MEKISLAGGVVKGEGIAAELGYKTANLEIDFAKNAGLETGVYACLAELKDKRYNAVAVIFKEKNKFEVHLLDYTGSDFYGETVSVVLLEKINDIEIKQGDELVDKIKNDIMKARAYFNL